MSDGFQREPGESLIRFYNRRLAARGREDVVWVYGPGGRLQLVDRDKRQQRMEFDQ